MFKTALKLIFRNWWRNKTFTLIAILSLTVGIAFTNLLGAFVTYEYGIEKSNPNKNRMIWAMQDMPSNPGEKVSYMQKGIPEQLKEKYPEVENFVQLNSFSIKNIEVNGQKFEPIVVLNVNASFRDFFPFELLYGSWETFNNPQSIVLSEKQARRFFGNENALGKEFILVEEGFGKAVEKRYTVGAVAKDRAQSAVAFDGLICDPENNWGSPTLLLVDEKTDIQAFEEKVKRDKIPTLADGQYYFSTFDQAISSTYNQQELSFWHYRKDNLLLVGLISAILIFLIAIFNYVNMSFSRVLQEVKNIHTQKLMNATTREIRLQLFTDTFLMVFISFLLSLLLMFDILPVFNRIVSADFSPAFFFSVSFFPFFVLFILLLTIIPALIISRKISALSGSSYLLFFIKKKNRWVGALVIAQFIIAIMLIISTITANQQVRLVKNNGNRYRNLIEIADVMEITELQKLKNQIENIPGVLVVSIGNLPLMNAWIMHGKLRKENGEEFKVMLLQLSGDENFLPILNLRQQSGDDWKTLFQNNPHLVFVNQTFADIVGKSRTDLIGEPFSKYVSVTDSLSVIAGVVEDFYFSSLEEKNIPFVIAQFSYDSKYTSTLRVKLDVKNNSETIACIKSVWQQIFPETIFAYIDTYDVFIKRNSKIFEMSRLLNMYSLISILLICFGLFGISFYTVRQRIKEIGIRKINGAKTPQILWLLLKPIFVWMAIGFVIAVPLAWWLMEKWLQQFAYRVDVSAVSCIVALIVVAAVSALTVAWHTWRTAKSNPVDSLRE